MCKNRAVHVRACRVRILRKITPKTRHWVRIPPDSSTFASRRLFVGGDNYRM